MKKVNDFVIKTEIFLSENPLVTMILYFLGFITSGYVTFLALSATSFSWSSKLVWASYTIVMEFGKAINYLQWVKTKKKGFYTMWLILTFFSIAASMTFMIIESNITENKSKNSGIFLNQTKETEGRLKSDLETAKNDKVRAIKEKENAATSLSQQKTDITKQIEDYNKTNKNLQNQINAENENLQRYISKGFWDRKVASENKISQLKDNMKSNIAARDNLKLNDDTSKADINIQKAENEITRIERALGDINYETLPQEKATAGFYALFQFFGITPKIIFWFEFLFTLLLTTTFEVLICMLYTLSKTGHFPTFFNKDPDPEKVKKPEIEFSEKSSANKDISGGKISGAQAKYKIKKKPKKLKIGSQSIGLEKTPKIPPKNNLENQPKKLNNISEFKPKIPPKKDLEIKIYLDKALNNLKENGDFPSRTDMSKLTGFRPEKCRTIHNQLKSKGVIQTSISPRRTWLSESWVSEKEEVV